MKAKREHVDEVVGHKAVCKQLCKRSNDILSYNAGKYYSSRINSRCNSVILQIVN
jgi:hypothetical protein